MATCAPAPIEPKRVRYLYPRNEKQSARRGTLLLHYGAAVRVVVRWDDLPNQPQWVDSHLITTHGVEQPKAGA
jgi:hypothetical protein